MVLFPIVRIPRLVRPSSVAAIDPKEDYLHTALIHDPPDRTCS